jgi:uncharacterized protein YjiS (DUF1127 family)
MMLETLLHPVRSWRHYRRVRERLAEIRTMAIPRTRSSWQIANAH